MNLVRYLSMPHYMHIFATIAPPGGVHIFACPDSFRKFAPKACIFSQPYYRRMCVFWGVRGPWRATVVF